MELFFTGFLTAFLFVAMLVFHEFGHRLLMNSEFVDFKIHWTGSILARGWGTRQTFCERANIFMAGFVYSLPFPLIALFWLGGEAFIVLLVFAIAMGSVDFFCYGRILYFLLRHRNVPVNVRVCDIPELDAEFRLPGLKGWWK